VGKNKNRGERGGQRPERSSAAGHTEAKDRSPEQEPVQSPSGFDQVTRKRQKRFGHN
jgi:hypothetical protein